MSYDRWGRTPEMARRKRVTGCLTIMALGMMLACTATIAVLVMVMACA